MRFITSAFVVASFLLAGCSSDNTTSSSIAGVYTATVFHVTPTGQSAIDVLAAGGSLAITISAANATSGTLNLPTTVTGGVPLTASMVGTATLSGSTVGFQQSTDTFVRNLAWTSAGATLSVTNQSAGGASYTISLTRQ
jgi:hypothetical protein